MPRHARVMFLDELDSIANPVVAVTQVKLSYAQRISSSFISADLQYYRLYTMPGRCTRVVTESQWRET